ncbi:hypothetical protein EVAR_84287_1 [Eumeta japonica]|uniref:Uncharacterized protein n=1 Tax=Eumeta variegata TaxID=151549 RepID=A0A4C1WRA1_EUMVA|nr:hypothetical protein EVAR_84287_1 [Eumeta japonica]
MSRNGSYSYRTRSYKRRRSAVRRRRRARPERRSCARGRAARGRAHSCDVRAPTASWRHLVFETSRRSVSAIRGPAAGGRAAARGEGAGARPTIDYSARNRRGERSSVTARTGGGAAGPVGASGDMCVRTAGALVSPTPRPSPDSDAAAGAGTLPRRSRATAVPPPGAPREHERDRCAGRRRLAPISPRRTIFGELHRYARGKLTRSEGSAVTSTNLRPGAADVVMSLLFVVTIRHPLEIKVFLYSGFLCENAPRSRSDPRGGPHHRRTSRGRCRRAAAGPRGVACPFARSVAG